MKKVEIYTKDYCPFCKKAVAVLKRNKIEFTEYDVTHNQSKLDEAIAVSSSTTVPQLFVEGKFIGGCDDLVALDNNGKLSEVLG